MRARNGAAVIRYLAANIYIYIYMYIYIYISGELAKTKAARDDLEERLDAHVQSARRASSFAEETVAAAKKTSSTGSPAISRVSSAGITAMLRGKQEAKEDKNAKEETFVKETGLC